MGFFPTDAIDGDEIGPNTNGTYFKYVAADDKWIILNDLVISDAIYNATDWNDDDDGATKNVIRDKIVSMDSLIDANIANVVDDLTPQLGGPLDLNDKGITHELVAAVSLVNGDLCYMNGVGKMAKAQANAKATCDTLLAMCLDTIAADATGTFLLFGKWTTSGLTAGIEYWVSDITAGTIIATRPNTAGDIIRKVGTAISTTVLFFNPSQDYIEYVV